MKQIFDWLREQIETRKGDAETRMYRLIDEDRGDRCVYSETDVEEFSVNIWADALSILDEAEAKWETEHKPYNVEKVVEQIHEYFNGKIDACEEDIIPHEILEYNKAICEIVRKGGME